MKYETVIGIIGNTQGVSSDRAPIVIASHINPQTGWSLISPSAVRATGAAFEFVEKISDCETATFEFESSLVLVFANKCALLFALVPGVAVGLGVGVGLVGVGEAAAPAAVIVNAAANGTVFGGRQTVSLQT